MYLYDMIYKTYIYIHIFTVKCKIKPQTKYRRIITCSWDRKIFYKHKSKKKIS